MDSTPKRSKSPMKFSFSNQYGSTGSDQQQQQLGVEETPRSPKIIYSKPSPTYDPNASDGIATPSSSGFDTRSPKYLPYEHQSSPRKSPQSPSKFVFDAVSPRHESIGNMSQSFMFFFLLFIDYMYEPFYTLHIQYIL